MPDPISPNINHNEKTLAGDCQEPGLQGVPNADPAPLYCPVCDDIPEPNLRDVNDGVLGWLKDASTQKEHLGTENLCDPMQTGQIVNEPENRNTVYRYSKALRGCDEAVMDLFRNVVVLDEDGRQHAVPIIWASQEKAVAAVVQDNVRKDNSLVVDRIKLPMLAISSTEMAFNQQRYVYHNAIDYLRDLKTGKPGFTISEKGWPRSTIFGIARGIPIDITYTLYAWTLYIEDMNQILEQVILKFSPIAYIRVRGVQWEVGVKLDSIANNLDIEPGDQKLRVIKFQFNITAETFIPQPIVRKKAILKTKVEFVDGITEAEITQVIGRLEETVREIKEC